MVHGAHITRPGEYGIFVYRDKDHQQECVRRVQAQEPKARVVTFSSVQAPTNAIKCY